MKGNTIKMLLFITYFVCLLNIILKKNKVAITLILFLMIILFGWSYGNADYNTYLERYNRYYLYKSDTEPLYTNFVLFLNRLGISFNQNMIIVSILFTVNIFLVIKKFTNNIGFVLGLYLIYPFSMNVVLQRYTIGLIFVFWAIYFLSQKKIIFFNILVVTGGLFHYSLLACLIFQLIYVMKREKIVSLVILLWCITPLILYRVPYFLSNIFQGSLRNKANFVYKNVSADKLSMKFFTIYILYIILFFLVVFLIHRYVVFDKINIFFIDLNIISITLTPLIFINHDFHRIIYVTILFNYIFLARCLAKDSISKLVFSRKNFIISFFSCVISIFYLILLVFFTNVSQSVFWPLFYENLLIY